MRFRIICIIILFLYLFSGSYTYSQVNGTTGLPLGGLGTGAIKYNASAGSFAANFRSPTRNGDYQALSNTQFQIFTQRGSNVVTSTKLTAVVDGDSVRDDAIFPLHQVNFGELNGITVEMKGYLPYAPASIDLMCLPAAMFEFTVTNNQNDQATVAIALQLGTSAVPVAVADSGFCTTSSGLQLCLLGTAVGTTYNLSYGNDAGFFSTGLCNNLLSGTTNRLSIRVSVNAQESKTLRFVLAWYQSSDLTHYHYSTIWSSVHAAAVAALENFDLYKQNGEQLVSRMRGSNLPAWLINQTLNSLVNLVNNSVFLQDGRYCHTEGMWTPEGTMDQMWHARMIYTMINPQLAWQELEWWARTQHVTNYTGQIHHDLGENFSYVAWDATEHSDYRTIYEWVDLNCGFIISVYEAFIATADQDKLDYFWPYVKLAAQRILDQVDLYGNSQYPYTFDNSLSSYDAGGNSQAYNSGLSAVTYRLVKYLAEIMGEPSTEAVYEDAWQTALIGFENRYLNNTYQTGNYCESAMGGPWLANVLKIDSSWTDTDINNLFISITNYYDPLNNGMGLPGGSYSEWQPYLISHLGGYALQTGRTSIWQSLQYDMYERNYNNRNLVFNQQLGIPAEVSTPTWIASSVLGTDQYISIPVLWRNYYDLVGFHYNKYSGELWLEPKYTDPSSHELQNALIITPDGYALMNYATSGEFYQNQQISLLPDQDMEVTVLYIADLYADSAQAITAVKVNGVNADYLRMDSGGLARIRINWAGTIPVSGITIEAEGTARPGLGIPAVPEFFMGTDRGPGQILLEWKAVSGDISGYYIDAEIGGSFRQIGTVAANDTSYLDTGLLPDTEYAYRIRSFNTQNVSEPSPEIIVRTSPSGNGNVLVALNAGGSDYSSGSGIEYSADATSGYVTGGSTYTTSSAIANTTDDALYQTERWGNFSYAIPLSNGFYNVVLKLAEIYQDAAGTRLFHVDMEGERVISNLDLYLRTGKNKAYDVVNVVELTDGVLNINFVSVLDNAKLNALEIREHLDVSVDHGRTDLPVSFALERNYPNPFNATTNITYTLAAERFVQLTVFDVLGRNVKTLVQKKMPAGRHTVYFDASGLGSGVYMYQLKAGDFVQTRKMILIK